MSEKGETPIEIPSLEVKSKQPLPPFPKLESFSRKAQPLAKMVIDKVETARTEVIGFRTTLEEELASSENLHPLLAVRGYENKLRTLYRELRQAAGEVVQGEREDAVLWTSEAEAAAESLIGEADPVLLVQQHLTSKPVSYMPTDIESMRKIAEYRDANYGSDESLMFHNNRDPEMLKKILTGRKVYSRREAVKAGIEVQFTQASAIQRVTMSREGIKLGNRQLTWAEVEQLPKGKPDTMNKRPLAEFDQVLMEENRAYYAGDWALVFPSREIRAGYNYSMNHDGVHLFPKNYDSSDRTRELSTGVPDFDNIGCAIDLDQEEHFLIAITDTTGGESLIQHMREQFPNLPQANNDQDFEDWYGRHVVEVGTLNDTNKIREAMFSRFEVPKYAGRTVATGDVADSAAWKMPVYEYIHN